MDVIAHPFTKGEIVRKDMSTEEPFRVVVSANDTVRRTNMVVYLKPAPAPSDIMDQVHELGNRNYLEAAVFNPTGPEREYLNRTIRNHGFARIGNHHVRRTAKLVLNCHDLTLTEASRVLLTRLSIAGDQQPTYNDYMAASIFHPTAEVTARRTPDTIAQVALHVVSDILELLLRLPQLTNHPDRTRLEERVATVRTLCGSLAFGPAPSILPAENSGEDLIEHGALLPESGIPDELIFQAVTQASEVLFTAASTLAYRAHRHLTHDQAALAATALAYASLVERPLLGLLGILVSMEVPTWLDIRPFIERPGAIQSVSYASLINAYPELERIATHARFPKHEQAYLPWVRQSLTEATQLLERWQAMHGGIASRYTPGGSPGIDWLNGQVEPIRHKRRAAQTPNHADPPPSESKTATAPRQGCPFGY